MSLVGPINSGAATGGAGVATANADSPNRVIGKVLAVYIKYNDTPPATTDVTIKTKGTSPAPPSNTIMTVSNAATDGWFYPRHQIDDETGTGATYDGTNEIYESVLVHDYLNVVIAQANDDDSVDVWLLIGGY